MKEVSANDSARLSELRTQCSLRERSLQPLVKIESLAYFVVQRPDPIKSSEFFRDFGLVVDQTVEGKVYLRGRSQKHHMLVIEQGKTQFARLGLSASADSLQKLSEHFGLPIQTREQPMGGRYLSLKDPNGLEIEINCELNTLPPIAKSDSIPWNTSDEKQRINKTVRKEIAPALVHKLGHTVHSVRNMQESVHWYQDTFGLIVSDFQFLSQDTTPIVAFMRCDQGDSPCDHHTIALSLTPELGHLHTAFEMDSMEEIAIANEWLESKKHKHSWGIGRHILGSQIFDYWRDADGDLFEHYADGDLFSADIPTGYHLFGRNAQHQWGPDMSANFTGTDKPWQMFKSVIKRLPSDDDLNFDRLRWLSKAMKETAENS